MQPYLTRVLNSFKNVKEKHNGWVASCPNPEHGDDGSDEKPSLRITIGEQGRILIACRVGCEIQKILTSVGLRMINLFPSAMVSPEVNLTPPLTKVFSHEDKDVELLNKVYTDFLNRCTLNDSHRSNLRTRGLPDSEIELGGYKTFPEKLRHKIAQDLCNVYTRGVLLQVPGFYCDNFGQVNLVPMPPGFIIPVKDPYGKISALKIRVDNPEYCKYLYWSSVKWGGPSTGIPIHCCPVTNPNDYKGILRITEGEIKAHVARVIGLAPTISFSGVSNWATVLPVLEHSKPDMVLLSWDWVDVQAKPSITETLIACAKKLTILGYKVGYETWPIEYKGIDDALVAGIIPTQVWENVIPSLEKLHSEVVKKNPSIPVDVDYERIAWEPKPFPLQIFPPIIQKYVNELAKVHQSPPDWAAIACLVSAARAIGTTVRVRLASHWHETPNIYVVIVGPPSALKSPMMVPPLKPLFDLQVDLSNEFAKKKNNLQSDIANYKRLAKEAKEQDKPAPSKPSENIEPMQHLYVTDPTVEAIHVRLQHNLQHKRHDQSLLYFRDEIVDWVRAMNQYRSGGKGSDRGFFLSAWSREDLKVDRKTDDQTIVVPSPSISIFGSIQPEVLSELEDKDGRADGFFVRILFSIPKASRTWVPNDEHYNEDYGLVWKVVVNRLLAINKTQDAYGRYIPNTITLTPAAYSLFKEYFQFHADEQNSMDFAKSMDGAWGKFRGYFGRFLVIIHCLRCALDEGIASLDMSAVCNRNVRPICNLGVVDEESVKRTIVLIEYFKDHYKGALKLMPLGPEERRLVEFVDWVKHIHNGSVTLRTIYHGHFFGCRNKKSAIKLCLEAADRDFGKIESYTDEKNRTRTRFVLL